MTDHRRALRRARPVPAGTVIAGGTRRSVRLRSRQHVVAIGCVAAAVDYLALLAERALLGQRVGAMEIGDVLGDHFALGILPWPLADAVFRIDGGLAVGGLSREIGAPGLGTGAGGLCEGLA